MSPNKIESFLVQQGYPADATLEQLSTADAESLWQGRGTFPGLLQWLQQQWSTATNRATLAKLERFRGPVTCPACQGARIRPEAASVRIGGRSLPQITALSIADARDFLVRWSSPRNSSQSRSQSWLPSGRVLPFCTKWDWDT